MAGSSTGAELPCVMTAARIPSFQLCASRLSYGGSGAIYWEGANGTIRDTLFFNNTGYHGIMGAASHYKFLEGVVHGDYTGDLYDNNPSKPAV